MFRAFLGGISPKHSMYGLFNLHLPYKIAIHVGKSIESYIVCIGLEKSPHIFFGGEIFPETPATATAPPKACCLAGPRTPTPHNAHQRFFPTKKIAEEYWGIFWVMVVP